MKAVAAAIRITSPDVRNVIEHAAAYARRVDQPCFAISIVTALPYGATNEDEAAAVRRNLDAIAAANVSPVMLEGSDVPKELLHVARVFGVSVLFVEAGPSDSSVAERLLQFHPPFDVIIVRQRNAPAW